MKKLLLTPLFFLLLAVTYAAPVTNIDTTAPAFQGKHIMVITLKKELRTGSDFKTTEACTAWKLMSSQAMEIFQNVKPITDAELASKFTAMAALMNGKCRIDNKNYTYELNAGSFLSLNDGQQTTFFGCYNKNLRKYFLAQPK